MFECPFSDLLYWPTMLTCQHHYQAPATRQHEHGEPTDKSPEPLEPTCPWCDYTDSLKKVLMHMESAHHRRWCDLALYPPIAGELH